MEASVLAVEDTDWNGGRIERIRRVHGIQIRDQIRLDEAAYLERDSVTGDDQSSLKVGELREVVSQLCGVRRIVLVRSKASDPCLVAEIHLVAKRVIWIE